LPSARAQFVPPSSAYQWSGAANSSTWSAGGNWVVGNAPSLNPPPDNADVLFGNLPSTGPEVAVNVNGSAKTLRALWFDAGKWYKLSGASLTLGGGLVNEGPVITVNAGATMSEINIDNNINFNFAEVIGGSWRLLEVTNHSEGGLRLGGTVSFINNEPLDRIPFLRVGGHGATHFANAISGSGFIFTKNNQTTHLVLSGNNQNWQGTLGIAPESLGFIKRNNALPSFGGGSTTIRANVVSGGTLGFRSHGHGPALNYSSAHKIQVQGYGAVRQWGSPPVGAVYNDGGQNTFAGDIQMVGDTWFGSRGDRNGGLTLTGKITGNYSFTKVGPGLITLTNPNNSWTGSTLLGGGVLRVTDLNALPTYTKNILGTGTSVLTHQLLFNGGILEFANSSGPNYPYYYYFLGTGIGQTGWEGSGGFSASGGIHQVAIVSQFPPYIPTLQWGQNGFVPLGKELLLSSRYADSPIIFTNPIAAGGASIRVERGMNANAYAVVSGQITGGSGNTFTKRGLGTLILAASNNNYSARTIIEQGALGGSISANSNITLRGGVVMLAGDFTRNVGAGPGQIQWNGLWFNSTTNRFVSGGGFAAWSGEQTVKLNNSTSVMGWPTFGQFQFGHYTASGTVIWDKQLDLGSVLIRYIRVERGRDLSRADVVFNQGLIASPISGSPIIGGPPSLQYHTIQIEGNGRMDIRVDNPNYAGNIRVAGPELRLHGGGRLSAIRGVGIHEGGILTLDNRGTHDSATGGSNLFNRLSSNSIISMDGGAQFRLWGREDYGTSVPSQLTFQALQRMRTDYGAINIDLTQNHVLSSTLLQMGYLYRPSIEFSINSVSAVSTSTLNLTSNVTYSDVAQSVSFQFTDWGSLVGGYYTRHEINDSENGDKIIPWATVKGLDWVMPKKTGSATYLVALPQYHTNTNTNTWDLGHNVSVNNQVALGSSRTINSLRLMGQARLNLRGFDLTLNSGGLLSNGRNVITSDRGRLMGVQGNIGKQTQRPFYAHIYNGSLEIAGRTQIHSDYEFVKTGDGTLMLNSGATHYFGKSLYINQGRLSLRQGRIQVSSQLGEGIYVGDGSGVDILELPPDSWDPIIGTSGLPSIFLFGTGNGVQGASRYDSNNEAILRMGGNTKLHLASLVVQGNAIIDWHGGEVGKANILWIENLTYGGGQDKLFMRNWYQYEDILLVNKEGLMKGGLNVIFEGYEDFPVLAIDYDANYWQITPFHAPEPSTYGAIFGALGLGVWGWKRRKRKL